MKNIVMGIAKSNIGLSMNNRYINRVTLNGFIIQKPRFITNDKTGNKSCSFVLHQINQDISGYVLDKTFGIICFIPSVIEKMKTIDHVCFVNIVGTFERNRFKKMNNCQVLDFEIVCLLDYECLPCLVGGE